MAATERVSSKRMDIHVSVLLPGRVSVEFFNFASELFLLRYWCEEKRGAKITILLLSLEIF